MNKKRLKNYFLKLEKILSNYTEHNMIYEWKDSFKFKGYILSFDVDDNLYDDLFVNNKWIEIKKMDRYYEEWNVITIKLIEFLLIPNEIKSFKNIMQELIHKYDLFEITYLNIPQKITLIDGKVIWNIDDFIRNFNFE